MGRLGSVTSRIPDRARAPPGAAASPSARDRPPPAPPNCRRHLAFAQLRLHRRGPVGNASALEHCKVRDHRPPVASAGGNDDGARTRRAAIGKVEAHGISWVAPRLAAVVATSSGMAISTPNFSAWLKARPASAMPDTGWEPQIVLDPRRLACLSAKGALIEHEHRPALGRGIDCGGKPRRSRAYHGDVVDFFASSSGVMPRQPAASALVGRLSTTPFGHSMIGSSSGGRRSARPRRARRRRSWRRARCRGSHCGRGTLAGG